jgi:two-component system nitrate/nitrite response regulator NarL
VAVRVLIVDPQPFFCEALRTTLQDAGGIDVVGTTGDELDAVQLAARHSPDVVLTEVELSAGSGLGLARRLVDRTATVVLTRRPEGEIILEAVSAGAMGCLGHHLDPARLASLVYRAADGGFAIDEARLYDTLKLAGAVRAPGLGSFPRLATLTSREREILQLVARGLDNRAIAGQLHLSVHTARTHVGNILRKLGVHSRAEAARTALQQGEARTDAHVLRIRGPDLENR